jgi:hypothetical protein
LAPETLLALPIRDFEAFSTPQTMDPLVVDHPAFAASDHSGPSPTPAGTGDGEGPEPGPEHHLGVVGDSWCLALSGPVLTDHATGIAFGDPEPVDEREDCSPTTIRG